MVYLNPNPNISVITLNINGLKTAIKRKSLSDWRKHKYTYTLLIKECTLCFIPYLNIRIKKLKNRKGILYNTSEKKSDIAVLISEKKDSKARSITRESAEYFTMVNFNPPRIHDNSKFICT